MQIKDGKDAMSCPDEKQGRLWRELRWRSVGVDIC
jgi:hypothetical protein